MLKRKDLKVGRIWYENVHGLEDAFLISSKGRFDICINSVDEGPFSYRSLKQIILELSFQQVVRLTKSKGQ